MSRPSRRRGEAETPLPAPEQQTLPFRIRIVGLPPAVCGPHERVEAGVQRGEEIEQSQAPIGRALEFSGELRLKPAAGRGAASPIFLGPYTHGPPTGRFLYISWTGEVEGQRRMFRRMKIPLATISRDQIERVRGDPRARLVATVHGTDRRGGPACATVPLEGGGWQVEQDGR